MAGSSSAIAQDSARVYPDMANCCCKPCTYLSTGIMMARFSGMGRCARPDGTGAGFGDKDLEEAS